MLEEKIWRATQSKFRSDKVKQTKLILTQLGKRPSGSLGNPVVGVDDAAETDTGPEECCQLLPIPSSGVDHVGGQDATDDSDDVVGVSTEGDGLDQELSRRDFADD